MRLTLFFCISSLLLSALSMAQLPPAEGERRMSSVSIDKHHQLAEVHSSQSASTVLTTAGGETDCLNAMDDDNNGLTDLDDFHCYFDETNLNGCRKSRILWASSSLGFHWLNVETGEEGFHALPDPAIYDDLTWSSNGKFYAFDRFGGLYELDPYTFNRRLMGDVEGYYHSNGMTGDANGNLYLCSSSQYLASDIVHYNVVTKEVKVVFSLSPHGLFSAGDLCFLNGLLYVMCTGASGDAVLAKINIHTKHIEKINIINTPMLGGSWGMTTLGDGFLYISNPGSEVYRLDPATGEATYFRSFSHSNMSASGFTSYPDMCHAPCRSKVKINVKSTPPFCERSGALLEAEGTGLSTNEKYTWTLPDGSTQTTPLFTATQKGNYRVLYHTSPDTCSVDANIMLDVISSPSIALGEDTAICEGSIYVLQPILNESVGNILWQDGSTTGNYTISTTGRYYATASNACGNATDTIYITHKTKPSVLLGSDTVLCNYDLIELRNLLSTDPAFTYSWSDGSAGDYLSISKPGVYWLQADNSCPSEIARDTIIIAQQIDGCECFLHIPNAFTPDGDGKNEEFALRSNCNVFGTLQVFNRWGELVYTTTDMEKGWDGRRGSHSQPGGLYVYVVNYEYLRRPGKFSRKGICHLIR